MSRKIQNWQWGVWMVRLQVTFTLFLILLCFSLLNNENLLLLKLEDRKNKKVFQLNT